MAKLRIRHVRETLARLFYRYARVRVYRASEREGERRRGRRRESKKEAAKERARGQHYPAIKSLAVKKRITQWHCAVTVRNEYQRNTSRMLSLSLALALDLHGRRCVRTFPRVYIRVCTRRSGEGICTYDFATRGKVMTYCHRDIFIKRRERY